MTSGNFTRISNLYLDLKMVEFSTFLKIFLDIEYQDENSQNVFHEAVGDNIFIPNTHSHHYRLESVIRQMAHVNRICKEIQLPVFYVT